MVPTRHLPRYDHPANRRSTRLADRARSRSTAAREAEWVEFLAELDEEEQSLERLRRWHRGLRLRDVLGAPSAANADRRPKECQAKLEDYTQRVFQAVGGQ